MEDLGPPRFDPSSAVLDFDPDTAEEEVSESSAKRKGYLKDPTEDERAFLDAQKRYSERTWSGPGSNTTERFVDSFSFNLTRPATGFTEIRSDGTGYQYGKAVDRYYDDFVREAAGTPGIAAEVGGTLLSPTPFGKLAALRKAPAVIKALFKSGGDAAVAVGEQAALQTETDDRSMAIDALLGGGTSLGMRGARGISEALPFGLHRIGHVPDTAADQVAQGMARGSAAVGPNNFDPSSQPDIKDLELYLMQQLLKNGGK